MTNESVNQLVFGAATADCSTTTLFLQISKATTIEAGNAFFGAGRREGRRMTDSSNVEGTLRWNGRFGVCEDSPENANGG